MKEMQTKNNRVSLIRSYLVLGMKKGFDNVSLEDIANDCGIRKPTIFSHFENYALLRDSAMEFCRQALGQKIFHVNFKADSQDLFIELADSAIETFTTFPLNCYFSFIEQKSMSDSKALRFRTELDSMLRARILVALDYAVQRSWLDIRDTDSLAGVLAVCMHEGIRRELVSPGNSAELWDSFMSTVNAFRNPLHPPDKQV